MAELKHFIILTGEQVDEIWLNSNLPYEKRFYLRFGVTNFLKSLLQPIFEEVDIKSCNSTPEIYKVKISFATESDLTTFKLTYM